MSPTKTFHLRRARRGFTLVELMVSLVMGLIVALAAVALARAATTTFHEQARSSMTEMGVRTAAERLRQDLMRVSFMSTPNIRADETLARIVGQPAVRYAQFAHLQGVRINVRGSVANMATGNNLTAVNLLNPDSIEITGNLTTDDIFHGTITTGGNCTNGQVVTLDPQADAAVYHLIGAPGASDANIINAFRPVATTTFIARVTDAIGCQHFVPVCDVTVTSAGGRSIASIHLQGAETGRAVLYANNGDGIAVDNNCGSSEGGPVAIAPVQTVRWSLRPSPVGLDNDPAGDKFDLVREWVDSNNAATGVQEVVAEYAIDLKFGIIVRNPTLVALNQYPETVYDLDSDEGSGNIDTTIRQASDGGAGPQHIRAVRFRVATRTSLPDREADIAIGPARSTANPYAARYCMEAGSLADCKRWARVRTIVSEVALHNQARAY